MKSTKVAGDAGLETRVAVLDSGEEAVAALTKFTNDAQLTTASLTSLENEPTALAAFDEWTRRSAQHVESKGTVEGADDVARSAKSTTQ
jgi:uncharacterized protein